jgi:hypothetical protein
MGKSAETTPSGGASKKNILISVVGNKNATWQGTVTLLDRKATRTEKSPHASSRKNDGGRNDTLAGSKETVAFRSTLELIRLINDALDEEKEG